MTYVGPSTLLAPSAAFSLGAAWAYQPKLDGCYARATLDDAGRIASVVSRTGRAIPEADELLGLLAGPPRSVLVGELEAHTEAGVAAYQQQGYRRLRLFDCLCLDGLSLTAAPYLERWGALHRAHSLLESAGLARVDAWDTVQRVPHRPRGLTGRHDGLTVRRRAGAFVSPRTAPTDLRRLPIVPLLRSVADARDLWRDVEAGTLEGLVAVNLSAPAGRRGAKFKVKLVDTLDCRVLASSGRVLHVATRAGTTQRAWRDRPTFTVQSRKGEAPGTIVEVAHHGYYKSGEPRFARVVRERSDLR